MGEREVWSAPIFRGLAEEDHDSLARLGRRMSFVSGEGICTGRARAGVLFVIVRGSAAVMVHDPETGQERQVALLEAGDSFGETSLVDGMPRQARVVARGTCVCWTLDRAGIQALKEESPGGAAIFLSNLAESMAQRLCRASTEIIQLQDRKRRASEDRQRMHGERGLRALWARWFGGEDDGG